MDEWRLNYREDHSDRTAITRRALSSPARWLKAEGLVKSPCLDYGCGKGGDADRLGCVCYDPAHRRSSENRAALEGRYRTILVHYVLNTVPSASVRDKILADVKNLLLPGGTAYVAVRTDGRSLRGVTKRGTWQGKIALAGRPFARGSGWAMWRITQKEKKMAKRKKRNPTKYKIQREYIYGWDDVEVDDGEIWGPFATVKAAQAEIDELIDDATYAFDQGYMDTLYDHSEYRVVPIQSGSAPKKNPTKNMAFKTSVRDRLPNRAFAAYKYIKKRKLPVYRYKHGKLAISISHVNNALARLNQTDGLTAAQRRRIKADLHRLQRKYYKQQGEPCPETTSGCPTRNPKTGRFVSSNPAGPRKRNPRTGRFEKNSAAFGKGATVVVAGGEYDGVLGEVVEVLKSHKVGRTRRDDRYVVRFPDGTEYWYLAEELR